MVIQMMINKAKICDMKRLAVDRDRVVAVSCSSCSSRGWWYRRLQWVN